MNSNERKEKLFLIYQIKNLLTDKIYVGCHITYNENDKYMGSSKYLKKDIKKFGRLNFKKETLCILKNKEDMLKKEAEIVTKEFCMRVDTYNRIEGGGNYGNEGMVCVKNPEGGFMMVYLEDPRYLSGELKPVAYGTVPVRDKDGTTMVVDKMDSRYVSGELEYVLKDMIAVKDKEGNVIGVKKDDPRYLSGELISINKNTHYHKGTTQVVDENGVITRVKLDDPRWLAGELVATMKNKVVVKDKNGKTYKMDVNDPKYLSGELVPFQKGRHYNQGTVTVKDKDGNFSRVSVNDPRYLSGELVSNMKGMPKWNKGMKRVREKKPINLKKVSIDGVIYDSIRLAALAFNTGKSTIVNRVKSKNFENYFYL